MAPISLSIRIDMDTNVEEGVVAATMSGFLTVALIGFLFIVK